MKIAIIGGTGKMGQLISRLLTKHGVQVTAIGRKTRNSEQKIQGADVILFSLPLLHFDSTISTVKIGDVQGKLLIDISSLVSSHLERLQELSRAVGFMHLLFGPDIYDIYDQHIVVSGGIHDTRFQALIEIFKMEGARIIESTPEKHDEIMALVQALSQFNSLALAKTLSEANVKRKELDDFASVTFSLNADVISRITHQDAELWASIQFNNAFFPYILASHKKNIQALEMLVKKRDYKGFAKMFARIALFWKEEQGVSFVCKEAKRKRKYKKGHLAVLGPEGSFSHQAAIAYNETLKPVFFDSIAQTIEAVASGRIGDAVLPFENSIQGTVLETLDGIYQNGLKITREIVIDIRHCIAGLERNISPNEVEFIYSHPQALAQCGIYLRKRYPRAKMILTPSTSAAFKKIKGEGLFHALAVGSRLAVKLYRLCVIDDNIQDANNNQTLFVAVSKKPHVKNALPSTIFVVHPAVDRPGLLYDILGVFKKRKINLSKIESRPSRDELGKYIFYLKADISKHSEEYIHVVNELGKFGVIHSITA